MTLLPRSTPGAEGLDPAAVRRLIEEFDKLDAMHGFLLLRNGSVVAEGSWEPYAPERPHMMFSVSKSFTSTAVGLAIDEGLFGLDDRVVDLLAEDVPAEPSPHLQAMRVRHLLTMTTGHDASTMAAIEPVNLGRTGGHWARQILAIPVEHEPGTRFVYNTSATYLAGVIVQRLAGQRLLDYLRPRLFEPLGITTATWEQDPEGLDVAGYGLAITIEELAAFGQLYLQRGSWQGRQIVPASWVNEATAFQVANAPHEWPEWEQGYGFQFWRSRHGAYRADGAFGQYTIVWPERRIVLAITSGIANLQSVHDAVWAALLPPPDGDSTAAAPPRLRLSTPEGAPSSAHEAGLLGVPHTLDPPLAGIRSITLTRDESLAVNGIPLGYGEWLAGTGMWQGRPADVAGSAAWTDESTLEARVALLGTPFIATLTLRPSGGRVAVGLDLNVSFGPTQLGEAVATPAA